MSDKPLEVREATEEDFDLEDDITSDEDYGFIIGPDGELKRLFLPEGFDLDPPLRIKRILKLFGIKDINAATEWDTLH
jgi:hypothetical protein